MHEQVIGLFRVHPQNVVVDAVGDSEFSLGDLFQQRFMFGVKSGHLLPVRGGIYAGGCTAARNRRVACR